jgi:hypothetical protein
MKVRLELDEREARALLATAEFGQIVVEAQRRRELEAPYGEDTPQRVSMGKLNRALREAEALETAAH